MEKRIVVFILNSSGIPDSSRARKVKELFSSPIFETHIVNPVPPSGWQSIAPSGLPTDFVIETYQVQWCLEQAKKNSPDKNVIIVKENSVSNVDSETLAQIVTDNVTAKGFQISYLCKWLDRCDLYNNKKSIIGKTTLIVNTHSPNGVQALLFTPEGRDIVLNIKTNKPLGEVLNDMIMKGRIEATTIVPNLIDWDITTATNNVDYHKTTECRQPPNQINGQSSTIPIIWFLVALVLIIIVAWAAVLANRRSS